MADKLPLKKFIEQKLKDDFGIEGVHVYIQPPASLKLQYPAIICDLSNISTQKADNLGYVKTVGYTLTVITSTPVSPLILAMADFPYCSFDRHYTSDNLYHDIFTLYY